MIDRWMDKEWEREREIGREKEVEIRRDNKW